MPYSVFLGSEGVLRMRGADVSGGGSAQSVFPVWRDNSIVTTAQALELYQGAFSISGAADVKIENTVFHDNAVAVSLREQEAGALHHTIIQRSKFINNAEIDISKEGNGPLDLRYNWWGSVAGPDPEKILGTADTDHWATQEDFRDPVILIPGILGSYPVAEDEEAFAAWALDPLFHIYDDLYQALDENGYTPEQDLFVFPYDWRKSNIETAILLKEKISFVKAQTRWPAVDIAAHSMGGLIAREYIESDGYDADVDQLITLGTPQLGASEAYLKWEGAKWLFTIQDKIFEFVFNQWAKHAGHDDIFDYLHDEPLTSVRELLPVYDYLFDKDGETLTLRKYPADYPTNPFLENLNEETRLQRLRDVEFSKIIGQLNDDASTISAFKVIDIDKGKYWEHGYPDDIDSLFGDDGLIESDGDETVPLSSASAPNVPADYLITLSGVGHQALPTEAQAEIYELLIGKKPETEIRSTKIEKMLAILLHSPIDIQIVAPDGKKVGKNFLTGEILDEIPGAFYTGYQTENEMVTIPNPLPGEYQVFTQGTGTGNYRVETVSLQTKPDETIEESVATIIGQAVPEAMSETIVTLTETGEVTIDEEEPEVPKDTLAPMVSIASPENKHYQNSQQLPLQYTAQDETTLQEKLTVNALLDGVGYASNTVDLSLLPLGGHTFSVQAKDEAGNQNTSSVSFVTQTSWEALLANIDHYAVLKLYSEKEQKQLRMRAEKIQKEKVIFERLLAVPRLPNQAKKILEKQLALLLKYEGQDLIRYIRERQERGLIQPSAGVQLVESVEALIQTNGI